MTVYVDRAQHLYLRGMSMCHMLADTPAELFDMAERLGVPRKYYQPGSTPHFDICKSKRARAVKLGAVQIDRKKTVEIIRAIRANPTAWPTL